MDEKNSANNSGLTPFHTAANNGHFDICKFIIDIVDDKNPAINSDFTPLHIAAQNGHLKFAASLLIIWMTRIVQTMVDSRLFTEQPKMATL